jgi:Tfp pilus assembly protein PilN
MIRINLLGVDRAKTRKAPAFDVGQQLTLACSLILVAAVVGIGWWYWTLNEDAARVETEITAAQQEQARLQSLLTEVAQFEAQRAQLQQRVQLIEQLRAGQSLPVQLVDFVSRSVPEMLWLTDMELNGETLTIQGRSTTLQGLSRFIENLGASDLLLRPIEIVDSKVETLQPQPGQAGVDVSTFTVKATVKKPEPPQARAGGAAPGTAVPPAPGRPGGAGD